MAQETTWRARRAALFDRLTARRIGRLPETALLAEPEPRTIGLFARGRQLVSGDFLFSGHLVEAPGRSIWDVPEGNAMIEAEVQGCTWLDDLAALGDGKARERAQAWVADWIARYGSGRGAGWTPGLTGRRVMRWVGHAGLLTRGLEAPARAVFLQSLARQARFLSRRAAAAPEGLPRFEAAAALVHAGLYLQGFEAEIEPGLNLLNAAARGWIDAEGAIPSRNPEELMEIFALLIRVQQVLAEQGRPTPSDILGGIERAAPTLRLLRHADGALARFQGGGRGAEGRLDQALAASGIKATRQSSPRMGYARLTAGRTTVIADAAPPPAGAASADAHASTLSFELTSGRRPLIVNCGSGRSFGTEWRRAGRATPSHSTLGIEGYSSSRLAAPRRRKLGEVEYLADVPSRVIIETNELRDAHRLELAHNGYQPTHGLTHARRLDLRGDGRALMGEDMLTTMNDADVARFLRVQEGLSPPGIPFGIHFHLHPDVDASLDMGGSAVSLALKSGEIWVFRHDGTVEMTLAPTVYLENGRLKPRAALQVVLSGRAMSYATRIRWSLAKAQETPVSVRDLAQDRPADSDEA